MYKVVTERKIVIFEDREEAINLYSSLSMLNIPALLVSESSIMASVGIKEKDILVKLLTRI